MSSVGVYIPANSFSLTDPDAGFPFAETASEGSETVS